MAPSLHDVLRSMLEDALKEIERLSHSQVSQAKRLLARGASE